MSTLALDIKNHFDTAGTAIKKKGSIGKQKSQTNITRFFRRNKGFMKFIIKMIFKKFLIKILFIIRKN